MAKLEKTFKDKQFKDVLTKLEHGILEASISATLEDCSDFEEGGCRCSVRVFERYSFLGKNRVSLALTLFQAFGGPVQLSAITSGGSQAMFMKINTFGEEAFLYTLRRLIDERF